MNKKPTALGYTVSLNDYIRSSPNEQEKFLQEFITESNLIEGITRERIQTIYEGYKEPEWDGHYNALNYMMENQFQKNIDTNDIKNMHKLMMHDLLNNAGEYRKGIIHIGKKGGPHARHVNKLMNELENRIVDDMNYNDIFNIHYMFENIHPFSDGNGRTGRLLLNWLTLKNFNEFNIITADHRKEYYAAINHYEQKFKTEHPKVRYYKDFTRNVNKIHDMILFYELQKVSEKKPFKI
jgi:Fic family protein